MVLGAHVAKDRNTKLWEGTLYHLDDLREAIWSLKGASIEALMIEIIASNDVMCPAGIAGLEHPKHGGKHFKGCAHSLRVFRIWRLKVMSFVDGKTDPRARQDLTP